MDLQAIPDELLVEIFIRLPTSYDVIHASPVCVSFRRILSDRSFLRRFRKLHAPPLLGFVTNRGHGMHLGFHPTSVPYPSTSAANAIALAADFSFSFLPARDFDWVLCDIRDGRVLLDSAHDNNANISFFTETVVCDPLHRWYLLLPPIPKDLVALVEDAALIKQRRLYQTFLLPPGGKDDEDSSFRVSWIAMCKTKLVSFIFSSSNKQWRAGPCRHWSDLFPDVLLLWTETRFFSHRQYANDCFCWLIYWREKLLILDIRMMEFSVADAPPGSSKHFGADIAITEEGEETSAMFVRASDTSYLKYTAKRNSGGGYSQWDVVKRFTLDPLHFFMGSIGRHALLYKWDPFKSVDAGCFSLDTETFQLERLCASMPEGSNMHIYSNFPLPLLPAPTVSSGTPEDAEAMLGQGVEALRV